VKKIKSLGVIALMLISACAGSNGMKAENNVAPPDKKTDKKVVDSGRPLRILPAVNVKNSDFNRPKDLFAVKDVSKLCDLAAAKKYDAVKIMSFADLKSTEKEKLTKAMDDYAPVFPENYKLAVDGVIKTDYNNNGFDDILVRYAVSYLRPVFDADGNENMTLYDYKYLTVLRRGMLVDMPKGDISDYYYQDGNKSSQTFVKIAGRNYLATMNRNGRLVRVDEIRTSKNDVSNHLFCELGRQK